MKRAIALALGVLVVWLTGCNTMSTTPSKTLPRSTLKRPPIFDAKSTEAGSSWWAIFDDPQLNRLMARVVEDSPGYEIAVKRIVEARLQVEALATRRVPSIGYEATAERNRFSGAGSRFNSGSTRNSFEALPLSLAYEVDLWGRLRHAMAAGDARAKAIAADAQTLLLLLQSELATQYFAWQTVQTEISVLERGEDIRGQARDLTRARFEAGDVSEIDNALAETELAGVRAERVVLQRAGIERENALAAVLGVAPSDLELSARNLSPQLPDVGTDESDGLFARRPDVRAARERMHAATAQVDLVHSGTFPGVELFGSAGFSADQAEDLGASNSETWSGGARIRGPLYEGGSNRIARQLAENRYAQAEAAYRETLLNAIRETETALQRIDLLDNELAAYRETVDAATRSVALTEKRYAAGLVDFFEVVNVQRTLLRNEQAFARTLGDRYLAKIELIKALGGSW